MKKILAVILTVVLLFALVVPGVAASASEPITVLVGGERVTFPDQGAVIIDNRVLVPVRGVFEDLNFNVDWNPNTRRATLTRGSDIVIITIGSAVFTTNGANHTLDTQAQIINGRAMLPLRLVLESVGYNLDWNSTTRTVSITSQLPPTVTIAATAQPTTGGSVTGGGAINRGTNVNLRATANSGWAFSGWYENNVRVNTNANWTFAATADRTLQARFVQTQQWTISVTSTAGGTATGGGTFAQNALVTLTAIPQTGWVFVGWYENNARLNTNATWSFNAITNRNIQARFSQFTITTTATTGGTATGGGSFTQNQQVTLVATPQAGWSFIGWYENNVRVNANSTWQFNVTSSRTLQARFIQGPQQWTITLSTPVGGGGTVAGGGVFNHNASVTVQASPQIPGATFAGWFENNVLVNSQATWTFPATGNRVLEARFTIQQVVITATTSGQGTVTGGGTFNQGTSISLVATPATNWRFVGWYEGGGRISESASLPAFIAMGSRTLVAQFELIPGAQ